MNTSVQEPLVEVYRSSRRKDAEEHALVLAAVGIGCTMEFLDGSASILVPASKALPARRQLVAYAQENHGHQVADDTAAGDERSRSRHLVDGFPGAAACSGMLVLLHAWSRQGAFSQDWLPAGAAQARLILTGEWWRVVTALGLHADISHLASNVIFGTIFGLLVAQAFGSGLGWLVILVAGAAGNGLNALIQPPFHTAIGASTAVFAAVGILSAATWKRKQVRRALGLRRWTPLAGGLMLLVYLGVGGERTDVGGHLAGFAMGILAGIILTSGRGHIPQGSFAQRVYGALATLLFALAWAFALNHSL